MTRTNSNPDTLESKNKMQVQQLVGFFFCLMTFLMFSSFIVHALLQEEKYLSLVIWLSWVLNTCWLQLLVSKSNWSVCFCLKLQSLISAVLWTSFCYLCSLYSENSVGKIFSLWILVYSTFLNIVFDIVHGLQSEPIFSNWQDADADAEAEESTSSGSNTIEYTIE